MGAIYYLAQIIQKKAGARLSKLSKETKTITFVPKNINYKIRNQHLLRPLQRTVDRKLYIIKLLKKIFYNYFIYFLNIKKNFKFLKLKSIYIKLGTIPKILFKTGSILFRIGKTLLSDFIKDRELETD